MVTRDLAIKEFNTLVRYLKRLDDIGDDFYLVGDMITPSVRTSKNKPGKHVVRSQIPTTAEYEDIVYGIAKLSETSKLLGDVKGKKQTLFIEQTEKGIWITVNDLTLQLAGTYSEEDSDMVEATAPNKQCFNEYLDELEWVEIPYDTLNRVKRGDVLTLEDTRHTTKVRTGKDLLKLRGVSRLSAPVDYTVGVNIVSPIGDADTIVVGLGGVSSDGNGMLAMHFTSPVIEAIHYYAFSPFY